MTESAFTKTTISLSYDDLKQMVRLARLLDRLSQSQIYSGLISPCLPDVARFNPGHAAVMMGYDFHITAEGPKLIEVNTNAGGAHFACQAVFPNYRGTITNLPMRLRRKVALTFCREYADYCHNSQKTPHRIVILDDTPSEQFLYDEMCAFEQLFKEMGIEADIVDPSQLDMKPGGIFLSGNRIDMIYNRHCDFYLESQAMAGVRSAYLNGQVCLTPNPHMYGLLADKSRLAFWSNPENLRDLQLTKTDLKLLANLVPRAAMLSELNPATVWQERKHWVFKPTKAYGSKGVLLGEKITRKRFHQLVQAETLVQQRAAPSIVEVPGFGPMKVDFRLFFYRKKLLGLTARLYQGQVTNMRTPGGGFAPVKVN